MCVFCSKSILSRASGNEASDRDYLSWFGTDNVQLLRELNSPASVRKGVGGCQNGSNRTSQSSNLMAGMRFQRRWAAKRKEG